MYFNISFRRNKQFFEKLKYDENIQSPNSLNNSL